MSNPNNTLEGPPTKIAETNEEVSARGEATNGSAQGTSGSGQVKSPFDEDDKVSSKKRKKGDKTDKDKSGTRKRKTKKKTFEEKEKEENNNNNNNSMAATVFEDVDAVVAPAVCTSALQGANVLQWKEPPPGKRRTKHDSAVGDEKDKDLVSSEKGKKGGEDRSGSGREKQRLRSWQKQFTNFKLPKVKGKDDSGRQKYRKQPSLIKDGSVKRAKKSEKSEKPENDSQVVMLGASDKEMKREIANTEQMATVPRKNSLMREASVKRSKKDRQEKTEKAEKLDKPPEKPDKAEKQEKPDNESQLLQSGTSEMKRECGVPDATPVISTQYPLPPPERSPKMSPPRISLQPPSSSFPASGGMMIHSLINSSPFRIVFKVKTSNNKDYRLRPVYGYVDSKSSTSITITRSNGPLRDDKMVVVAVEVPRGTDASAQPQDVFKMISATINSTLTLPIKVK